MDVINIITIISAVSALILSILNRIKISRCNKGEFEVITSATTPTRTSFQVERPEISAPIPIPKLEKKPLLS